MRYVRKIKGIPFLLWHGRHFVYHILFGILWAWILREIWQEFNLKWFILSVVGSELPDADHFIYFLSYGRKDDYTRDIVKFLKERQWRLLITFVETGHKTNTNLIYHNLYFISLLVVTTIVCLIFDWKAGVVLIGAMILHYLFDIWDDYITLGYLNHNWRRWGRTKKFD